ncbi:MAG: tetratricopeptide repeat protein [Candidatus Zixiibacteriota bacterium]|nr:MAG: tetratricopeptide repeat protein [candidate division Zixibacteria bacterium]
MSECIDTRLGDKLYCLELGLLDDSERIGVEQHLLKCDHCAEKAVRFAETARLLRESSAVRDRVSHLVEHSDTLPRAESDHPGSRKLVSRFWSVGIAAAVLLFLLLTDWKFEISPRDEAVAESNRLVILYFDNIADTGDSLRFGEIVPSLLITDLSESDYVNVVSSQRLYDVLKLMGQEGEKHVSRRIATEVAERAGARWMLTGRILQVEPQIMLTSELVEVSDGQVLATQRISGRPGETVFSLVDELTVEIKEDLSLPALAREEPDPLVATVTTSSIEAYRYYVEAKEQFYRAHMKDAVAKFRSALEYDADFAIAHTYLALIGMMSNDRDLMSHIVAAEKGIDRVSRKERMYIRALSHALAADWDKTVAQLEELVERYPDAKSAYYCLAWVTRTRLNDLAAAERQLLASLEVDSLYASAYQGLTLVYLSSDNFERAGWSADKYILLRPDDAIGYYDKAKIYALQNDFVRATDLFNTALDKSPGWIHVYKWLGPIYLHRLLFDSADYCLRQAASREVKSVRSDARTWLALVPLAQGRVYEALSILDDGIAADRLEHATHGDDGDLAHKHLIKARIYVSLADEEAARAEVEQYMSILQGYDTKDNLYGRSKLVDILCQLGNVADAEQVVAELRMDLGDTPRDSLIIAWTAGLTEAATGNYERAIAHFEPLAARRGWTGLYYELARAYLQTGDPAKAAATLEKQLSFRNIGPWYDGIRYVESHYYLAQAYEQLERHDDAIKEYKLFLNYWENAETGLAELDDSRERLIRLRHRL